MEIRCYFVIVTVIFVRFLVFGDFYVSREIIALMAADVKCLEHPTLKVCDRCCLDFLRTVVRSVFAVVVRQWF